MGFVSFSLLEKCITMINPIPFIGSDYSRHVGLSLLDLKISAVSENSREMSETVFISAVIHAGDTYNTYMHKK